MNIAIIGYGKMGKALERIAKLRNHNISLRYDNTPNPKLLKNSDLAIEFSQPNTAFQNVKICIENNIPVVCGTTGWLEKLNIVKNICLNNKGSFLYSSNFSIGMNIFYIINKKLSNLLYPYSNEYEVIIKETHHTKKIDKPSGTAISLANDIISSKMKKSWKIINHNDENKKDTNSIFIESKRLDNVIGEHKVIYKSIIEKIVLKHEAYNRDIFAIGAIIAAEWLLDKKGFFSMKDVLEL
ncbi:4-hydroxy-tetrahydrodipicolinate reductase [Blattabacterium cuenoti]|uniref:4-hydroxy-tetrahydrodipicolinate reductase n=1 Tax=Blattabacterium cuenoti TaxID=1653831 RepID=UPI00163C5724|nr:4-hydroxy-tetrahydrodipicolinate reductase [Blattabacterium cuenoti]